MDGQRKQQSKKKQHMLHKAMKKNKTKEINDENTNIMMWFVAEVTDIIYPTIIQYEERKIAERDVRDEEANAKKFVFTDKKRTPSRSPGCEKRGSRGQLTPLFSQQSPGLSPTSSRPLSLGGEFWEESLSEAEPTVVAPHQADSISSLCRETMCMGGLLEHPTQAIKAEKFPHSQTYFKYESTRKDGKLQNHLIREDISSDFKQYHPKTGLVRKFFSLISVQGRGSEEQVQREGQMPRQLQVPELLQPTSGGIRKLSYCTGAPGLKPSTSPLDIPTKPRTVCFRVTLPQTGRQLARKPFFSSPRKIFPEEEVPHKAVQGARSKPLPTYAIEPEPLQSLTNIYSYGFLKEICDELMRKFVPSQNLCAQDTYQHRCS
ncbi:PREDICTED: uncharacterized protein LOC109301648 [Gavialis gangeticus]|uniref:uncharacterized protein LOC109301648 n=1 Tax=Gavialis gangeticus TaxID=94835 RepID=UPI00092EEE36|nr:PREDICTED: uncharacterized protein LOC109301648 [Gavialis gangeticus]